MQGGIDIHQKVPQGPISTLASLKKGGQEVEKSSRDKVEGKGRLKGKSAEWKKRLETDSHEQKIYRDQRRGTKGKGFSSI